MDDKARSKSWPADAGKYPLNASKKGPVYSPPIIDRRPINGLVYIAIGAMYAFIMFCAYALFEYFFIPG